jgi:hypothetical protein
LRPEGAKLMRVTALATDDGFDLPVFLGKVNVKLRFGVRTENDRHGIGMILPDQGCLANHQPGDAVNRFRRINGSEERSFGSQPIGFSDRPLPLPFRGPCAPGRKID